MPYTIKNLEATTWEEIALCHDLAFSDYSINMSRPQAYWVSRWLAADINLTFSIGAFMDSALVAYILHGVRIIDEKKLFFNMATGVTPDHRGNRLVKQMYSYIRPFMQDAGFDGGSLEVLTDNHKAISAYKTAGFETIHTLNSFKLKDYQVASLPYSTRDLSNTKKYADIRPNYLPWENTDTTLINLGTDISALEWEIDGDLIAYALQKNSNGLYYQVGIKPKFLDTYGPRIFQSMYERNKKSCLVDVDTMDTAINPFLIKNGHQVFVQQFEMVLELS